MAKPPGLINRGGTYYYRRRVPKSLVDIGILPRAPRCAGTVFHSQTAHAFSKAISIDSIAITQ